MRPHAWILVAVLLLLSSRVDALPMVHLDFEGGGTAAVVGVGETVRVDVWASGIPPGSDGLGLFGFGWSLGYDAGGLGAADPVPGSLWVGTGFSETRNQPGDTGLLANRFFEAFGPFGDDILLGSVVLTALVPGLFSIELSNFTGIGDNVLFDGSVLDSDPAAFFGEGSIEVVPIPNVPATHAAGRVALSLALILTAAPSISGAPRIRTTRFSC